MYHAEVVQGQKMLLYRQIFENRSEKFPKILADLRQALWCFSPALRYPGRDG